MLEEFKKENILLRFDNVEEQNEFLKIADLEWFKWDFGVSPSKFTPLSICSKKHSPEYIGCYKDSSCFYQLYYGREFKENVITVVSWKEYKKEFVSLKDYNIYNSVNLNKKQIEKLDKKKVMESKSMWLPKNEDVFFYSNIFGRIEVRFWDIEDLDCQQLYTMGNVFQTKEEAENYTRKKKLITDLQRFAYENNDKIDWNNANQLKYYIYYDFSQNKLNISWSYLLRDINGIYFSSEKLAKQVIKEFGDRMKEFEKVL